MTAPLLLANESARSGRRPASGVQRDVCVRLVVGDLAGGRGRMKLVAPPLAPATQMSFWGPPGQGHVHVHRGDAPRADQEGGVAELYSVFASLEGPCAEAPRPRPAPLAGAPAGVREALAVRRLAARLRLQRDPKQMLTACSPLWSSRCSDDYSLPPDALQLSPSLLRRADPDCLPVGLRELRCAAREQQAPGLARRGRSRP